MNQHPSMEVMCHVNNCKFNEANYCFAPKIEVNAQSGDQASSSTETVCTTFKPQ
ncbi:protein of unknown function DUF1540 [Alkaliphilus metalliredigens QYMF]|uniref:DUF1540 domain-containing protein n=1 Tax=Alkaliphilus metalliredigens (strain QYMF) TaxID=293826 RepID=A6TVF2_ALKMQ|nr:DUF1540 domain-containing protein [Alkaliphilus metalliredigens]ABR50170.1 protein of unknown function DUF1540 [Alkaliphilus metalliredigens QYMF]